MRDDETSSELHGLRHLLKPAQEHVLASLLGSGENHFTRARYEELAHVSRSQAAYDLADLVKLGLVERIGAGRATSYRVVREEDAGRRKWTAERIRAELERFCGGRERWPRAAEFREAGRAGLYLAASRYGGIEHWTAELGFRRPAAGAQAAARAAAPDEDPDATGLVVAGLAALALAAVVLVVLLTPGRPADVAGHPSALAGERADAAREAVPAARPPAAAGPAPVRLRLAAEGGAAGFAARAGSASGRLLWRGTLEPGESLRLRGRAIWLRLDAPASVAVFVDGGEVAVPRRATRVRVTSSGVRVLARAPRQRSAPPAPPAPPPTTVQPVSSVPAAPVSAPPATTTSAPPAAPASDAPAPDLPPPGGSGPSPDAPPSP